MAEDTYNGWTNYETWNVNLWLDNDEPLYRDLVSMTRRALVANTHEEATEELAPLIEDYVTTLAADGEGGFKFGDLDTYDELLRVDWEEIAAAWVDTWKDED